MSDENVTVDMVAMFRQNTDALLRAGACIGFASEYFRRKGALEEAERLENVIVDIAAVYGSVTGEDPVDFARLLDTTLMVVMEAAQVSPLMSRDKLNA